MKIPPIKSYFERVIKTTRKVSLSMEETSDKRNQPRHR
jgi:hypothetical protein